MAGALRSVEAGGLMVAADSCPTMLSVLVVGLGSSQPEQRFLRSLDHRFISVEARTDVPSVFFPAPAGGSEMGAGTGTHPARA